MLQRLLLALAAGTIFVTATGVAVVALAFALFALVEPYVGRAGAAAIVVGAAALLMLGVALALRSLARRRRRAKAMIAGKGGPLDRILGFVREEPLMAASAALGAGFMAIRNPRYLGATLRSFFEGREAREPRRKR